MRLLRRLFPVQEKESVAKALPEGLKTPKLFAEHVFPEELAYIRRSRRARGVEPAPLVEEPGASDEQTEPSASDRPSTAHRLIGLALSGGGIRSATFNLGVLQALQRAGFFERIDLMSTVSGGGFVGSSLTSMMSRGQKFPFEGESEAVVHLRNNSNYLAPSGLLDYLRMFGVLVRGIILNGLVLVPFLLVPCLLATLVYGPRLLNRLKYDETVALTEKLLTTAVNARNVKIAGGQRVEPLLELLERGGFLPLDLTEEEGLQSVTSALRNPNPAYRDVKRALLTGRGGKEAPFTFLPETRLSHVAHRLVEAHRGGDFSAPPLLVPPESIEEVQAVELFLRRDLGEDVERDLEKFLRHLKNKQHLPIKGHDAVAQPSLFMVFVTEGTLVEVLSAEGMIEPKAPFKVVKSCAEFLLKLAKEGSQPDPGRNCGFTKTEEDSWKYSLTQILQAFYDHRLFDRRKVQELLEVTGQTRDVVYKWPHDEPTHRQIEVAALHLWNGLFPPQSKNPDATRLLQGASGVAQDGKPTGGKSQAGAVTKAAESLLSVKALFDRLPDLARGKPPLLRNLEKEQSGLLAALKGAGIVVGANAVADVEPKKTVVGKGLEEQPAAQRESGILVETEKLGRSSDGKKIRQPIAGKETKIVATGAAQLCSIENKLVTCEFADARSLGKLPLVLYESGYYEEEWFKKAPDLTAAASPDNAWESVVRKVPLLGDWLGPHDPPVYRERPETDGVAMQLAVEKMSLQPGSLKDVLDRLVHLSREATEDPPLMRPTRTDPQERELREGLRMAFADEQLLECRVEDPRDCSFKDEKAAVRDLPRLLYRRKFYNRAWFERYLAKADDLDYRRRWDRGWRTHRNRLVYRQVRSQIQEPRPEPGSVEEVVERLVRFSKVAGAEQAGASAAKVALPRPPTTPAELRKAFEYYDLIDCEDDKLASCRFKERAPEEIPVVLLGEFLDSRTEGMRLAEEITAKLREPRRQPEIRLPPLTAAEIERYIQKEPTPEQVQKRFKSLREEGLLLPDQPGCRKSENKQRDTDARAKLAGRRKEKLKVSRQGEPTRELPERCAFALDKTVQWLFDKEQFLDDPRPVEGSTVVRKNVLQRLAVAFERHALPLVERRSWNPRALDLPVTVWVTIGGLLWVLAFPIVRLLTRIARRDREWGRDFLERSFALVLVLIAGVAFVELQPYLVFHWHHLEVGADWSMVMGGLSVLSMVAAAPALSFFKRVGKTVVIVMVSLLGPLLPFVIYLSALDYLVYSESSVARQGYDLHPGAVAVVFLIAFCLVHLFLLALDPNSTGMHEFYKGRLSKAYLLRREDGRGVVGDQDLPLAQICSGSAAAPYHLLNVALNLQGSRDASVRDRHSGFFTFSGLFAGGGRNTGYCRTEDMALLGRPISLGTAMAVSGAAAAPNMGAFTIGSLVMLMALLNVRLGYWVPNPREVRRWSRWAFDRRKVWLSRLKYLLARMLGLYRLQPGPYVFLRELLSRIDDQSRIVNVSDGGHLENTGIFELLRRRCAVIIASDAEADEKLNFGGLAALQRLARLDLDVEIEISTKLMAKAPALGRGRRETDTDGRHFAVGRIVYPKTEDAPREIGYLVYLKSSLNGDESPIVAEYRGRKPKFPHEPTADQSYDEGQFEAYRDLGSHVVDTLHKQLSEATTGPRERALLKWLERKEVGWKTRRPAAAAETES